MKITDLSLHFVEPRWLFLIIETDAGITGYGEPIVEGRVKTVKTAVEELAEYLIGKDPRHVEHHWQAMYRDAFYRGGPVLVSAISGVEQALWDITGKWLDVPVYQLLGGAVRHRIRMYKGVGGTDPDSAAANASAAVRRGFTAIKTGLHGPVRNVERPSWYGAEVARIAAVREAVGPDVDLAVDFHGQVSPAVAVQLAQELEPLRPMFIEEPCQAQNVDTLVTIARSTSIPVATGERLFTRWDFRQVLEKQAAAVVQPDISHAGGIFECRKIAAMAEVYYGAIAPHCPLGPIALAACLQMDACTPNFLVQEHATLGERYLKQPFELEAGYIQLPSAPGLGIELDMDAVLAGDNQGSWKNRQARYEDGAVADW